MRPAGLRWTCEDCGTKFSREKSGDRPIRFCSPACYQSWNRKHGKSGARFATGHAPWNKDKKGLHLNPATEYKKGRRSERWLPVGSETIREDKTGNLRAFIKLAEPNVWRERAIIVWERENGPLPEGKVVHHRDRDSLNDAPRNLQDLTRAEHINEHRHELKAELPVDWKTRDALGNYITALSELQKR